MPEDLIFTHLDEEHRRVKLWNFVLGTNCSLGWLGGGQKIPGEFHRAESSLLFPHKKSPVNIGDFAARRHFKNRLAKVLLNKGHEHEVYDDTWSDGGIYPWRRQQLAGDCASSTVFWHASVTALVGGILARWCGRMWLAGLADALEQQRRARAQASENKTTAKV